jgi:hypothetical protein
MMHFEQIVCQYLYNLSIIAGNAPKGSGEDTRSSRSRWWHRRARQRRSNEGRESRALCFWLFRVDE